MEKQVLVNNMKQFLRGVFKNSDLTVGEHREMKHHLEDFMSVSKPIPQSERFVELMDSDGDRNLIKVSAISNIIEKKKTGWYYIDVGGQRIDCKASENEEILENLIADLRG